MKTTTAALRAAKNLLESDDSWLWLAEVQLDASNTLYLAASTERVTFAGQDYEAFPFKVGDIDEAGDGTLEGVDLLVHDFSDEVRAVLRDFDLDDQPVTLKVVHSANLSTAAATIDETFGILGWGGSDRTIRFRLGHASLMEMPFPARKLLRNRCGSVFKQSATCGYAGSEPTCDRTLEGVDGCRAKGNTTRFGGAPALARARSVV